MMYILCIWKQKDKTPTKLVYVVIPIGRFTIVIYDLIKCATMSKGLFAY